MKTYIKVTNKSYHFHPKMLIVLILDDENNYYIIKTVKILLFNNEINNTNKTILSFNFIYLSFILSTKKGKKETIYMVTVLVIESLSISQKPQELQVVTTRDYIV